MCQERSRIKRFNDVQMTCLESYISYNNMFRHWLRSKSGSRFIKKSYKPHLDIVRRILKYVEGTFDLDFCIRCEIVGHCGVDFVRDHDRRQLTIG